MAADSKGGEQSPPLTYDDVVGLFNSYMPKPSDLTISHLMSVIDYFITMIEKRPAAVARLKANKGLVRSYNVHTALKSLKTDLPHILKDYETSIANVDISDSYRSELTQGRAPEWWRHVLTELLQTVAHDWDENSLPSIKALLLFSEKSMSAIGLTASEAAITDVLKAFRKDFKGGVRKQI